jgi:hypothetical protein
VSHASRVARRQAALCGSHERVGTARGQPAFARAIVVVVTAGLSFNVVIP